MLTEESKRKIDAALDAVRGLTVEEWAVVCYLKTPTVKRGRPSGSKNRAPQTTEVQNAG